MCAVLQSPRRGARHALQRTVIAGLVALTGGWITCAQAASDQPPAASAEQPSASDDSVDLLAPEHTIVGSFVRYAPDDQELTIVDENDEELIFAVDNGVLPSAGGRALPFGELHAGDQLALTVIDAEDGSERVTAIDVTHAPVNAATPAH